MALVLATVTLMAYRTDAQKYISVEIDNGWQDAEDYCVLQYGSHLASVHSASARSEAHSACDEVASAYCWIGLSDLTTEASRMHMCSPHNMCKSDTDGLAVVGRLEHGLLRLALG